MEHASAGAGADNNPVKRCLTNVFSCLWVQSQHFWDGLRKNKHWRIKRCQANHSGPHLYLKLLEAIVPNKTKQNQDCDCIFSLKSSESGAERWISCLRSAAVPRPACRMRWLVPNSQHPGSRCDAGGRRWGRRHCWRECIRAADYWAQSGKPGGGNTL